MREVLPAAAFGRAEQVVERRAPCLGKPDHEIGVERLVGGEMHRGAVDSPFDVDVEQVVADAVSAAPHEHLRLPERREGRPGLDVGVAQHRASPMPR
ncbi:hypothetical protein NJ76_30630, partial [Rhodococcus sp. IITR03]